MWSAEQHVCQRVAHLRAELREHQDVAHFAHGGQIDGAACVEHEHEVLVFPVQGKDVANLGVGEHHVARDRLAVAAFARSAREHVDRGVGGKFERDVVVGFEHHGAHRIGDDVVAGGLGLAFQLLAEGGVGFEPMLVIGVEPRLAGQLEARVAEPLLDVDHDMRVHVAGPRSALHAASHAAAVCGQLARPRERERSIFAQEHHAFGQPRADARFCHSCSPLSRSFSRQHVLPEIVPVLQPAVPPQRARVIVSKLHDTISASWGNAGAKGAQPATLDTNSRFVLNCTSNNRTK